MNYVPEDGKWVASDTAGMTEARSTFTDEQFAEARLALKYFLCSYFSSGDCTNPINKSISPIGRTRAGGKILKVRWAMPGAGKRGGLRLVVVVFCEEKRVVIAEAFPRRSNPTDDDFAAAAIDVD